MTHKKTEVAKKLKSLPDLLGVINAYYNCSTGLDITPSGFIDRCSLVSEYILSADAPFPGYHRQQNALPKAKKTFPELAKVQSEVLQTAVRRLHDV